MLCWPTVSICTVYSFTHKKSYANLYRERPLEVVKPKCKE